MSGIVAPPDAQLTQTPTVDSLRKFEGLHIKEICGCQFVDDAFNHCAHFVSHAMGFHLGYTCRNQTGKGKGGASIRVHELFRSCPEVGGWSDRPMVVTACLVFVTAASNVKVATKTMANVPAKHVGIYLNGTIWHYSNRKHKVVTQAPEAFNHHYSGKNITLFYGTFPS